MFFDFLEACAAGNLGNTIKNLDECQRKKLEIAIADFFTLLNTQNSVEPIVKQRSFNPQTAAAVLQLACIDDLDFEVHRNLLASFLLIMHTCNQTQRKEIFVSVEPLCSKMIKRMLSCGDIEIQFLVMEILTKLAMTSGGWKNRLAAWLSSQSPVLAKAASLLDTRRYDFTLRLSLNLINSSLQPEYRIHSLPCLNAIADGTKLQNPQGFDELWVDCSPSTSNIRLWFNGGADILAIVDIKHSFVQSIKKSLAISKLRGKHTERCRLSITLQPALILPVLSTMTISNLSLEFERDERFTAAEKYFFERNYQDLYKVAPIDDGNSAVSAATISRVTCLTSASLTSIEKASSLLGFVSESCILQQDVNCPTIQSSTPKKVDHLSCSKFTLLDRVVSKQKIGPQIKPKLILDEDHSSRKRQSVDKKGQEISNKNFSKGCDEEQLAAQSIANSSLLDKRQRRVNLDDRISVSPLVSIASRSRRRIAVGDSLVKCKQPGNLRAPKISDQLFMRSDITGFKKAMTPLTLAHPDKNNNGKSTNIRFNTQNKSINIKRALEIGQCDLNSQISSKVPSKIWKPRGQRPYAETTGKIFDDDTANTSVNHLASQPKKSSIFNGRRKLYARGDEDLDQIEPMLASPLEEVPVKKRRVNRKRIFPGEDPEFIGTQDRKKKSKAREMRYDLRKLKKVCYKEMSSESDLSTIASANSDHLIPAPAPSNSSGRRSQDAVGTSAQRCAPVTPAAKKDQFHEFLSLKNSNKMRNSSSSSIEMRDDVELFSSQNFCSENLNKNDEGYHSFLTKHDSSPLTEHVGLPDSLNTKTQEAPKVLHDPQNNLSSQPSSIIEAGDFQELKSEINSIVLEVSSQRGQTIEDLVERIRTELVRSCRASISEEELHYLFTKIMELIVAYIEEFRHHERQKLRSTIGTIKTNMEALNAKRINTLTKLGEDVRNGVISIVNLETNCQQYLKFLRNTVVSLGKDEEE